MVISDLQLNHVYATKDDDDDDGLQDDRDGQ